MNTKLKHRWIGKKCDMDAEHVEQVRNKSDIVELINKITSCKLIDNKSGYLIGRSPLQKYNENKGIIKISKKHQSFYCEATKQGGDIFQFMMLYGPCDFEKAVGTINELF